MAIEKGLYEAPMGLGDLMPSMDTDIEIEIETPDAVMLDDGGMEIALIPDSMMAENIPFEANLAEFVSEDVLQSLGDEIVGDVESDITSRKEWSDTFVEGLDLLGLKHEERGEPWDGACGVYSSLLSEAAIRFQAETMAETFPASGPVKTKIIGIEDKETREAAERVKSDMNYQLTEVMDEYRSEHERMLYSLGLSGSAFKKVYYDDTVARQVAMYVPAEEIVVPYGASNLKNAERITHIMRKTTNEVDRLMQAGFYRDIDLGDAAPYTTDIDEKKAEADGFSINEDGRHTLFEVHVDLAFDDIDADDNQVKPYIVTIDTSSNEIIAIYRNWEEGDTLYKRRQHFVHYIYSQGFGFYGLGLIHIIGGYARAGTSLIRQLVDAGTLANLPGGLKTRDLRVRGDDTPIAPGEWKDVDVTSGSLRENLMPLPYKEPSQTLLALLDKITNEGRRLGAISDIDISDMSANAPVGTTLALLERTLKPMTAVQSRVHYAMKTEFRLIKDLIADRSQDNYDFSPSTGEQTARKSDYLTVDVIPVSDPNSATMAQKVVQYQAVMQMAQSAPQIYDLPQLHRQMVDVIGIKNADKIIPLTEDHIPKDPVSENMAAMVGKPIKAFVYQDHDAHIATHTSMMQNPQIMQAIGQNPMTPQIMSSLQAHITEHVAFKYRAEIEAKMGVELPPPDEQIPEEIELQLSRLLADASMQITEQKKQEMQAQQNQAKQQDPLIQLQQQDAARKDREQMLKEKTQQDNQLLKLREQQRKETNDQVKSITEQQRLELEQEEMALKYQMEQRSLSSEEEFERARLRLQQVQGLLGNNNV